MAASTAYDDFWGKAAPGLFDLGMGIYNRNQGSRDSAALLNTARGPTYNPATTAANGMLAQAGNFDPQAFAAKRFGDQQALVAPVQQKQQDDLMRSLYSKGMLGISNYNPGVEGITPNGTAMNPQMAAFFAAQNAQRSKDAYGAMGQGQDYLNNLIKNSGMLSDQATKAQDSGIKAQVVAGPASRGASNVQLAKGIGDILKNTGVLPKIPGMLGSAVDWFKQNNPFSNFKLPQMPMVGDFGNDFNFDVG